ncbi:MAG: C45 family peptidase [Candidatus Woesearchaeota archaeon]
MKLIKVKGTNYQIGYKLGHIFSSAIKYRIKKFKITKRLIDSKKDYLEKTLKLCEIYPNYLLELKGISDGSNTNIYEILMLNLLGLLDIKRCSTIAYKGKNSFIAHNEDGDTFERKKDFALIKYEKIINEIEYKNKNNKKNKKFYFYSYFYPGELLGATFSWNSYGLIITVNSIRSRLSNIPKLPRVFVARALLEAKTINQAIKIIKNSKSSGGLHYLIMKKTNKKSNNVKEIVSIERYQNSTSIEKINNIYIHTNHYIHKKFLNKTKPHKNSVIRYERLKELIELHRDKIINADKEILLKIMRDRKTKPNSIYNKKNDTNQTLATFIALKNKKYVFL